MTKKIVAIEDNFAPKDNWLRIEWNLGKRCNYDCSYCGSDIHDNKSQHLDLEVIENTVEKISQVARQQKKECRISLTGGEPFVHPRIIEILKTIKKHGIQKISVTTNGSVPLSKYIESIDYINYYIFSYHFEFAYHDKIINTIIELDKKLKTETKNKNLHVHLMFLPGKLKEAKEIIEILKDHDIHYAIRRIRPRIDSLTGKWALPGTSGMTTVHGKCNDPYYSKEEIEFITN
jgi:MoaA/NifB/PqqE/SkfB family radical SAM enzyme